MKPTTFLLLILFVFLGCKKQQTSSSAETTIAEEIQQLLTSHGFNGNYLIKEQGQLLLDGSMGFRDFETKDSLRTEHQFYLASISKQITAMACLILVHQDKLSLDDKLSSIYPDLPFEAPISIRQLLNHTSGIPDYYELGIYKKGMKNSDVYAALMKDTPLDFEPGSQYKYSNSAYVLLSMIVSKVSNSSFKDFIHTQIFEPLEMNNSVVFDETTAKITHRAIGFTEDGQKKDYHAYTTGGGGIFSTIGDLALWEKALYTDTLIPESMLQLAYKPTPLSNGEISYYGFGWVLDKENSTKVSHSGSLEGFRNLLVRDLEKKRLIIFLSNNSNGELKGLANEVEKILDTEKTS